MTGVGGDLAAVQASDRPDRVAADQPARRGRSHASTDPNVTAPTKTFEADELGIPRGPAAQRYASLGAKRRASDLPSGAITMGDRVYDPALGRFLQTDPVPGGSANACDYDPVDNFDLDGDVCWRCAWRHVLHAGGSVAAVLGTPLAGAGRQATASQVGWVGSPSASPSGKAIRSGAATMRLEAGGSGWCAQAGRGTAPAASLAGQPVVVWREVQWARTADVSPALALAQVGVMAIPPLCWAREPKDLVELSASIHDWWFELDELRWDQARRLATLPLRRPQVNGRWIQKLTPSAAPELKLEVANVVQVLVQNQAQIGIYDVNDFSYEAEVPEEYGGTDAKALVCLQSAFTLKVLFLVAELDARLTPWR